MTTSRFFRYPQSFTPSGIAAEPGGGGEVGIPRCGSVAPRPGEMGQSVRRTDRGYEQHGNPPHGRSAFRRN